MDAVSIMGEEDCFKAHHQHLIEILRDIISYRSTESEEHIWYVQQYTRILAEQYAALYPRSKMTKHKIDLIVQAAQLHDVGKITMPDSILTRSGMLSKSELDLLKEHTIKGSQIVKVLSELQEKDYSRICYNVCLYHHEKYDGTGYPCGLKGDKIPVEAQIVGLADMYDVLVNPNMNKEPYPKEKAYYMLMNGRFGELSPKMRECLEESKELLENVHKEGELSE